MADLGFYGVSRNVHGFKVPHFQVVVGGQWEENAGSYGLPIVAIPSKRIPEVVELMTELYVTNRESNERFMQFVQRMGKAKIRQQLEQFTENLPEHDADPTFYSDWGDPRQYTTGDIGKGECAGEVVSQFEFEMTAADRLVFGAQVLLEEDDKGEQAGIDAYKAMLKAAKALVLIQYDDVSDDDPDEIVDEFKERYYDTQVIYDPFAGPKFADYFFAAHDNSDHKHTKESAHHLIEEAQLFIEAIHSCYNRIREANAEAAEA